MIGHRNVGRDAFCQHSLACLLAGTLLLTGCASTSGNHIAANKNDPYEGFNRTIYQFNNKVDRYVAKPVADAYTTVTPKFFQTWLSNLFKNLKTPNIIANDLLQGKFSQGGQDFARLAMNSTLGLAGIFDVAKSVGLDQHDEDFEQTLAVWGLPRGPYWVIPLLGPASTRGIPGMMFDTALHPTTYMPYPTVGYPIQFMTLVDARANASGALAFIDEASLDPYVFTRESFLQWRDNLATDGKSLPDDFDDEVDTDTVKPAGK